MKYLGKNRSGFTILEVMVAVGLLTATMIIMFSLMISMLNMWIDGSGGTSANSNTAIAMRKLVLDIEQAKSATMLDTFTAEDGYVYGRRLQVTFPYYDSSTTSFVKSQNGSTSVYYLSGRTGSESSGHHLWKSTGSNRTLIAKNVDTIRFSVTNSKLVRINLKGLDPEHGTINPNYLQQSVKLRNS